MRSFISIEAHTWDDGRKVRGIGQSAGDGGLRVTDQCRVVQGTCGVPDHAPRHGWTRLCHRGPGMAGQGHSHFLSADELIKWECKRRRRHWTIRPTTKSFSGKFPWSGTEWGESSINRLMCSNYSDALARPKLTRSGWRSKLWPLLTTITRGICGEKTARTFDTCGGGFTRAVAYRNLKSWSVVEGALHCGYHLRSKSWFLVEWSGASPTLWCRKCFGGGELFHYPYSF